MVSVRQMQNALLAPHVERAQRVAETLDAVGECAVGPAAALIDEGDLVGPAGIEIALENIGGEIVGARDRGVGRERREIGLREVSSRCFLPARRVIARHLPRGQRIMPARKFGGNALSSPGYAL